MNGIVTDIETMGLVDGPGMRLVIFLAGCNFRCKYCHNPETWVANENCKTISPNDVLNLYNKYKAYYGDTGGVTFSGGEPLLQYDFIFETSKLLKEHGIHVALDTAGGVPVFNEELLNYVDLIILDIKAVEDDEFEFITGQKSADFKNFLQKVSKNDKKLWLRQVIVPNINDDEGHVLKLKEFAKAIPNVEKIELLPYHSMGIEKYKALNLPYPLEKVPDMDKEKCKKLQKLLKNQ